MAVYNTPGIYIDEIVPEIPPVLSSGTGVTAFLGFTTRGPAQTPVKLSNMSDFAAVFGKAHDGENLSYALQGFFDNGGSTAYVSRLTAAAAATINPAERVYQDSLNANILTIKAGYKGVDAPGVFGNTINVALSLTPQYATRNPGGTGAGTDVADLAANADAGATSIQLTTVRGIQAGNMIRLQEAASPDEIFEVERVEGNVVYLSGAIVNASFGTATTKVDTLEYTLVVSDSASNELERWENLSLGPNSLNYVETLLNDNLTGSIYVKAVAAAGASALQPVVASGALSGGADEISGFVVSDITGVAANRTGLRSLDDNNQINLLCIPFGNRFDNKEADTHKAMLDYAKERMDLFAILDPKADQTPAEALAYRNNDLGVDSYWGAMYYPRLKIQDPARPSTNATLVIPPSGHIAGLYARVAGLPGIDGGISASPAGLSNRGQIQRIIGLERPVSDTDQGSLNPAGVNCIRLLPSSTGVPGIFVFGARTLSDNPNFRYIAARRTMTYIEQTIKLRTRFAIFKKNGPDLWTTMRSTIESFLTAEWTDGNLSGDRESDAYFVELGESTTSAADIQNGIVRGKVGVSLFRPAEFIVFTFTQAQSAASIEE